MPHNSHEFNVRREEQLLAVFPITKKKIKKKIYIYNKEFKYGTDLNTFLYFAGVVKYSLKLYFPLYFLAVSKSFSL